MTSSVVGGNDAASGLSLKERIKFFSKADDENDLVRLARKASKAPKKRDAVDNAMQIAHEAGKSREETLRVTQNRLAEVDDRLAKLTNDLGQKAFGTKEFRDLLEERDDYLEILKSAGVTPQKPSHAKSKVGSRRPGMPRRRSRKISARRLKELNGKHEPQEHAKTAQDEALIRGELTRNFIFKNVRDEALEEMLKAFEPIDRYQKGDVIIQQHDVGDYFYILGNGSVIYEVDGEHVGGSTEPGTSFGELALLYQSPRKATVLADSEDMRVYRVDHMTFRYILQSQSKFKAIGMKAMTKIKAANRLLSMMGLRTSSHKRIPDVSKVDDDSSVSEHSVCVDECGEVALSAIAKGDCNNEPVQLDFGHLAQKRETIKSSMMSASNVSVDTFRRSAKLGEGQFGEVWLVQPSIEEIDEERFALKIQSKEDMGRTSTAYSVEETIRRECDVLSTMVHPFIVEFVHSFEDAENIYMVMGAIKGKELWECIHREQEDGEWVSGISEGHARFYTALIADTLNYVHQQQACHRDIKPENVMINEHGYPVLIDLGFSKRLPNETTYTLCGTPKYTAPEIITNEGHGCAVDFWALGVVVCEMLSGENPFWFEDCNDLQLFNDICNAEPYPIQDEVDCGEDAKDIIMKLLEKDPKARLFSNDVTSHPWFDSIDFQKARKMELSAPELL